MPDTCLAKCGECGRYCASIETLEQYIAELEAHLKACCEGAWCPR